MVKSLFILLLVLLSFTSCIGQIKTEQTNETVVKQLSFTSKMKKLTKTQKSNEYYNVYCSLQDNAGNIWFGTRGEGVYKFDGKEFTQFTVQNGLANNSVFSILQDKEGNIWFGTMDGPCRYDARLNDGVGQGKSIVPIRINQNYFYDKNSESYYNSMSTKRTVWSMMQDKSGRIWFGTGDGVYCFADGIFTRFLDNKNIKHNDSLHLKMVASILEDKKGNIWFCSGMLPGNEGIHRFDGKSITSFKPNGEGWVRKVIEGKDGNLYFATRHNGVYQYDGKLFTNITEKAGIDNGSVTTVMEDKPGNLWIGTELGSGELGENGGVWRFDGQSFTLFTTKNGLIHNGVFCILEDTSENIWFGTRNVGLSRFDGKTFTTFSE